MFFHHGSRLKKLIDKSPMQVSEISKKSGVALSSLYDIYKKEELTRSKIGPILKVLNIEPEDFFNGKTSLEEPQPAYYAEIEALKRENQLLREQVAQLKEIIELNKRRK